MVSNTLFSVLFALCTMLFAVSAEHGHNAAAHELAHQARAYGYGDVTLTTTSSSTSTVYKTITVKKTDKYTTKAYSHNSTTPAGTAYSHKTTASAKPHHYSSNSTHAPYTIHNYTSYVHPTATGYTSAPVTVVQTYAPTVPGSTTAAPTVSVSGAAKFGAWSGVFGLAVIGMSCFC
jgi:hypothetical protein